MIILVYRINGFLQYTRSMDNTIDAETIYTIYILTDNKREVYSFWHCVTII